MKLSEAIRRASDSLTEETWIQGVYFRMTGSMLCMCAHGAMQAQVNPIVSNITGFGAAAFDDSRDAADKILAVVVRAFGYNAAGAAAAEAAANRDEDIAAFSAFAAGAASVALSASRHVATRAAAEAATAAGGGPLLRRDETWISAMRSIWDSRPDWVSRASDRGTLEAHFLLGLVGLTATFNDDSITTLSMVKAKYEEAALLAEALGV